MPPRLQLSRSVTPRFSSHSTDLFFCSSCSLWRLSPPTSNPSQKTHPARKFSQRQSRRQPTSTSGPKLSSYVSNSILPTSDDYTPHLASRTAINAPINVSSRNRPLYDALEKLKSSAANYVNLSRLRLALRGLERGQTAVRIAVLGFGGEEGKTSARRLLRLLLADPLIKGKWEEKLERANSSEEDGRGLLIRSVANSLPPATVHGRLEEIGR